MNRRLLFGVGLAAAALGEAATNAPPAEVRGLLRDARQSLATNDYAGATAKYNAVLAQDPQNLLALSNLGVIHYQQGRLDAAEAVLRQAIAIAPDDSGARSLLGAIQLRQGKLDDALAELTRAVALDTGNAEAHNFLGIVLSEKGKPAEAEHEVRRALELKPEYADAHINLAVLYLHEQPPRLALARHHYRKAIALGAPADPALEAQLK